MNTEGHHMQDTRQTLEYTKIQLAIMPPTSFSCIHSPVSLPSWNVETKIKKKRQTLRKGEKLFLYPKPSEARRPDCSP